MNIDHLSLTTTPVILRNGGTVVSQGTGFYFISGDENQQRLFLVTNYHVVTGSSPTERKTPIGNNIVFQFHNSEEHSGDVKSVEIPLYTKQGKPIWITNNSTPDADMVVIPIPTFLYNGCVVKCISEQWASSGNLRIRPTSSVTLIGYPYGFYDTKNALPIYKTGCVASEPYIDFEGMPSFLIDISAFPGMSGSPAFAIAYGIYENEEGNSVAGGARRFLGIYASMQMLKEKKYLEQFAHNNVKFGINTEQSLELGHVWKAKLIIETINGIDIKKYEEEILSQI